MLPPSRIVSLLNTGSTKEQKNELRIQRSYCNVGLGDKRGNDNDDEKDDDDKTHTHTHKATNYALNRAKESPHKSSHGTKHINADISARTHKQPNPEHYKCSHRLALFPC